jgi:Phosphodiester glycosidase
MRIERALLTTILLANPLGAAAQNDTVVARGLSRGVVYRQFVDKTGPFIVHFVRVNLREPSVELRAVRAHDELRTRERTTEMVRRLQSTGASVLVAVNADFFNLQTGENENNQVIAGEWWKGVKNTDSPYDTYDNAHVQFALDARRRPLIDRFLFDGRAWARGTMTPIITLNFNQPGNPEGVVLYTSRFGATTPRDTTRVTAEASMAQVGRKGDTLLFVRRGAVRDSSGSAIPAGGAVLSAYGAGSRLKEVHAMADGDTVKILLATIPRLSPSSSPTLVIGGWPRILRNGENVVAEAPVQEGTISRNAEARHPRTAIGFSRDSSTLYLLVVDGRQEASVGMTLTELATLMRRLGAWNAMNFDGGGSTTMVVDGVVVNKPSDSAGEREIASALAVVKRP